MRSLAEVDNLTIVQSGGESTDLSMEEAPIGRRGGKLYFIATLVSQACALLRYIVLARLLGPEQLGLAATLVVTGTFFDLISDTGADRFLIQDRHGDAAGVQKLVQLVLVGRGFLSAAALLVFAIPIAHFYNAPKLATGLAILSLSPLAMGFLHLDVRRAQRSHDFRFQATCMIAAELAGLAATVTAAWLTHDFTAILYGLITRSAVWVLVSHLGAKRAYRLGWDQDTVPRLTRFALPLLLNGFLLFITSQGDRVIVANQLGAKALGLYSAIILLIYYPAVLLGTYINGVNIPLIAGQRDSIKNRNRLIDNLSGQLLILAVAMVIGFAFVAPTLAPLLFGARFSETALLVGLIGILQSTRFMFGVPLTAALAMGRSATVLTSNFAHLIAFAGAFVGLRILGGLSGVVAGFIGGEFIALAVSLMLLNRDSGRSPLHGFERLAAFMLTAAAIVGWNLAFSARLWPAEVAVLVLSTPLMFWICRSEWPLIVQAWAAARATASPLFFVTKRR
jgi:lipopolysaccharide exporter